KPRTRVLNLTVKEFKYTQVNNPALGSSSTQTPVAGDLLVFSATLANAAGARVGTLESSCTVTVGGVNWNAICYSLYALKSGQVDALSRSSAQAPDFTASVVGGSGTYAGARGRLSERVTPNAMPGAPVHETITLTG
ncbi:MAG TPA: hypothetical protein VK774_08725, partial [Solirubrobacteraceae bacterium]|nr:hypothetical protein [Solirubrobacteraceae bacterium]